MKALISLADMKSLLSIRPGNTEFDPRCKVCILAATSQIEDFTGRKFSRAVRIEHFTSRANTHAKADLHGISDDGLLLYVEPQTLRLDGVPIDTDAPMEVRYDPRREFGEGTVVAEDRWRLDPQAGTILLTHPTVYRPRAVQVTYTAGFTATAEDGFESLSASLVDDYEPLKLAAQMQALHLWNKTNPENIGLNSDRTDAGKRGAPRFAVQGGIIPEVASLIQRFRRLTTGRA